MSIGIEIEFEHRSCTNAARIALQHAMNDYGRCVDDQSLRGQGGEFVTSVMNVRDCAVFIPLYDRIFEESFGFTRQTASSERTGLHIHFSNSHFGLNTFDRLEHILQGAVLLDAFFDGLIEDRTNLNYCMPERYNKCISRTSRSLRSGRDVESAIRDNADKYTAVNILPLLNNARNRTIEFRMFPSDISQEQLTLALFAIHLVSPGSTNFPWGVLSRNNLGLAEDTFYNSRHGRVLAERITRLAANFTNNGFNPDYLNIEALKTYMYEGIQRIFHNGSDFIILSVRGRL